MPLLSDSTIKYYRGDLVYFHVDPTWELEALHCSDGCAYDQDGLAYSTGIIVSRRYVGGFNWQYSYDVLCANGELVVLAEYDIEGVVGN